jgi:FMN phosphatase YigB (HAD superfamily)
LNDTFFFSAPQLSVKRRTPLGSTPGVSLQQAQRILPNILSRFTVVLLDMNGTFMFGGDRFGPDQDFEATYHALGGRRLAARVVQEGVLACFETLGVIYDDSARCDAFPTVMDTLRDLPTTRNLPENELKLLERVIAEHELGTVPDTYALALNRLAATHRLGVIANIISRKEPWLKEFARAGVLSLFAATVFSSDGRSVKPSRKLFEQALDAIDAPRSEVVFVGDSLRCDIGGAARAGLASIWIDRTGRGRSATDPEPTFIVRDLLELINGTR